jgi:hypothetical protein
MNSNTNTERALPAPLTRTDIARIYRRIFDTPRMESLCEEFAREIERAVVEALASPAPEAQAQHYWICCGSRDPGHADKRARSCMEKKLGIQSVAGGSPLLLSRNP